MSTDEFLVISDIHFGFNDNDKVLKKLNKVIDYSESRFLIFAGDLIGTFRKEDVGRKNKDKKD